MMGAPPGALFMTTALLLAKPSHMMDIVSKSSRITAKIREIETKRDDALIRDPLASILSGPDSDFIPDSVDHNAMTEEERKKSDERGWRVVVRTKYFDDYILKSVMGPKKRSEGDVEDDDKHSNWQVVMLGAGLDSRAFRLLTKRHGVTFYEVDRDEVLQYKKESLARALNDPEVSDEIKNMIRFGNRRRIAVPCDVQMDGGAGWKEALLASGFDTSRPTCWVLEGLTYYLDGDDVVSTLFRTMHELSFRDESSSSLSASATSCLIMSVASEKSVQNAKMESSELKRSFSWGTDRPAEFLSSKRSGGWKCDPQEDVVVIGGDRANYGRCPKGAGGGTYVTARY